MQSGLLWHGFFTLEGRARCEPNTRTICQGRTSCDSSLQGVVQLAKFLMHDCVLHVFHPAQITDNVPLRRGRVIRARPARVATQPRSRLIPQHLCAKLWLLTRWRLCDGDACLATYEWGQCRATPRRMSRHQRHLPSLPVRQPHHHRNQGETPRRRASSNFGGRQATPRPPCSPSTALARRR